MEKQDLIDKLEKFDLTEIQLQAIDNIIAGEVEFNDFGIVLYELSEHLSKTERIVYDIGDVGNEIGLGIGKFIKNKNDKREFIMGIEHGISLIDGTHDL
jgi:hypothetical protein